MHPKNIYNKLIDFAAFSKKYPEFASIARIVSIRDSPA